MGVFNPFGGLIEQVTAVRSEAQMLSTRSRTYAESVSDTWDDPIVAAKRKSRHATIVTLPDGTKRRFYSVKHAFTELKLDMAVHIRVRQKIKAAHENGQTYRYLVSGSSRVVDGKVIRENERVYVFRLVAAEWVPRWRA